jgi:hypothetical protein
MNPKPLIYISLVLVAGVALVLWWVTTKADAQAEAQRDLIETGGRGLHRPVPPPVRPPSQDAPLERPRGAADEILLISSPAPEGGAPGPLLSLRGNGVLYRRAAAQAADWTRATLSTPRTDALVRDAATLLDAGESGPLAVTIRIAAGVREGSLPATALQDLVTDVPVGAPWRGDRVWLALVPLPAGQAAAGALPFESRGRTPADFAAGGAVFRGPQRQVDRILASWVPGTLLQGPGQAWRVAQCDPLPPPTSGSAEPGQALPQDPGHDQDGGDGR